MLDDHSEVRKCLSQKWRLAGERSVRPTRTSMIQTTLLFNCVAYRSDVHQSTVQFQTLLREYKSEGFRGILRMRLSGLSSTFSAQPRPSLLRFGFRRTTDMLSFYKCSPTESWTESKITDKVKNTWLIDTS